MKVKGKGQGKGKENTFIDAPGIPEGLSIEFVRKWVEPRVSAKRLKHICGVVEVAKKLAGVYDCDIELAELAAWLHDACKEIKDTVLVEQAKAYGMKLTELEEKNGHLLHGPVAALLAKAELGITNQEVLDAISEHTLGNVSMSKLSEVLFLADCIDETRPDDYTAPIWAALSIENDLNIAKAILTASDLGLKHLIESGRAIHPRTVDVRNHYLALLKNKGK